jgi:hypothetical protein
MQFKILSQSIIFSLSILLDFKPNAKRKKHPGYRFWKRRTIDRSSSDDDPSGIATYLARAGFGLTTL